MTNETGEAITVHYDGDDVEMTVVDDHPEDFPGNIVEDDLGQRHFYSTND